MSNFVLSFMQKERKAFSLNALSFKLNIKPSLLNGCLTSLEANGLIVSFRVKRCKYYMIKELLVKEI